MSVGYSTIAWGASVDKGRQPDVQYGYKAHSTAGTVFNFFSTLGDVAFAYAGHNVVFEIQGTIPSTPEKPSKKPMWKGVIVAYIIVAICYFPVALIYAMPVFDMIETVLVKKLHFTLGLPLHLIFQDPYMLFPFYSGAAFTMFIAITFPFFGGLLGFFGGFAFTPTTYFLPCIMWLAIYKPKKSSLSWITNWICIVFGVLLMIISPIRGPRQIIIQAKDY
ncbi:hypothetical protein AAC387_Pa05g0688 [Persea americana]